MHIAFLTHYFTPESNAPAVRVHALARRWAAAGHQVTVITGVPNVPNGVVYPGYRNRWRQEERIDGIRVIRVWTFVAPNRGAALRTLNYLSYLLTATLAALTIPRPHVFIATSPQFFCGWAGALAAHCRRVPFLLEIRDLWPESIAAVGALRNRLLLRFLERLERALYKTARHIVTVGEGYRSQVLERGVAAERISVVPNGVEEKLFSPRLPDPALLHAYGIEDEFVCAYVGTIGMACGLDVVLRTARKLKEQGERGIRFLLVGDGAERARLQRDARTAGLDLVIFTGRLERDKLPDLLASCQACLVHLRSSDTFETVLPSKIFEAAAMERPIVLGVRGCAAELVREAACGICVEPEDEDDLLAALFRLRDEPEFAATCGRSGREYVMQHFNCNVLAEQYIEILNTYAAPSTGRSE